MVRIFIWLGGRELSTEDPRNTLLPTSSSLPLNLLQHIGCLFLIFLDLLGFEDFRIIPGIPILEFLIFFEILGDVVFFLF